MGLPDAVAEAVANVVAFLCGPESEMIVGQNIIVDGGLMLLGLIQEGANEA